MVEKTCAVLVLSCVSATAWSDRLLLDAQGHVLEPSEARITNVKAGPDARRQHELSFDWLSASAGRHELVVKGLPPQNYFLCIEGFCAAKHSIDEYAQGVVLELNPDERHLAINKTGGSIVRTELRREWVGLLRQIPSSANGTPQPCYFWAPEKAKTEPVPLIVGLHTWSGDYRQLDHYASVCKEARRRGWAFVGPNFRGPNNTPAACGGDLAVQDIVDAVNYAKRTVKIDANRVYIIGGSGGGHMTLLMVGRHPEVFAAGVAFCPITDLARWHADSLLDHPGRGKHYARMMEDACGGTPAEKPDEYRQRSPLTHLARAREADVPVYIVTGIHDGWAGSVPVGHSFRAFNALARPEDGISEEDIAAIERDQRIPETLSGEKVSDPFYLEKIRIHFRRTSGNAQLTIFEGGHGGNFAAGYEFLSRQRKGRSADFTLPKSAQGREERLGR